MKIAVELEPAELWFLTSKAEARGLTLSEWIRGTVLAQFHPQVTTRDRIKMLHRNGATDAEISLRLQISKVHIASVRRGLGLKPNNKYNKKENTNVR